MTTGQIRACLGAWALTPVQRVSAASLDWQLHDAIRMASVSDQRFVFDQFRGLRVALVNFLSQVHPLRSARDVDNYLVRLRRVAPTTRGRGGLVPGRPAGPPGAII